MMNYVSGSVIPAVIDGGTWAACFGLSWMDLMLYDQVGPGRIIRPNGQYLRKQAGTMGVAGARNEISRFLLDSDAEWLFMVDSDMGFSSDTVDRMIDSATRSNALILGALCFSQQRDTEAVQPPFYGQRFRIQPTIYRYVEVASTGERGFQPVTKYRRNAFQMVSATGAACILIHRTALEKMGNDPFSPITDPKAGGNGTARTFSEDLSFCIRAQGVNISVAVDTSIQTTHHKGGIFLDETTFAMQQETLIQAKGQQIEVATELAVASR